MPPGHPCAGFRIFPASRLGWSAIIHQEPLPPGKAAAAAAKTVPLSAEVPASPPDIAAAPETAVFVSPWVKPYPGCLVPPPVPHLLRRDPEDCFRCHEAPSASRFCPQCTKSLAADRLQRRDKPLCGTQSSAPDMPPRQQSAKFSCLYPYRKSRC